MGNSARNLLGGQGTFEMESERGIRLTKGRNGIINNPEDKTNRGGAPEISPISALINMRPSQGYEPDHALTPGSVTRFIHTPF